MRIYDDVDQANRRRLDEIVEQEFSDEPLDLVVDDCSHKYKATRASFNELFPRLRPGGLYTIEDWGWAHPPPGAELLENMWPDEVPLTRLLFELVLAVPSTAGLISEITIETELVQVRAETPPSIRAASDLGLLQPTRAAPSGQRPIAGAVMIEWLDANA